MEPMVNRGGTVLGISWKPLDTAHGFFIEMICVAVLEDGDVKRNTNNRRIRLSFRRQPVAIMIRDKVLAIAVWVSYQKRSCVTSFSRDKLCWAVRSGHRMNEAGVVAKRRT